VLGGSSCHCTRNGHPKACLCMCACFWALIEHAGGVRNFLWRYQSSDSDGWSLHIAGLGEFCVDCSEVSGEGNAATHNLRLTVHWADVQSNTARFVFLRWQDLNPCSQSQSERSCSLPSDYTEGWACHMHYNIAEHHLPVPTTVIN
jgi:hypothetical protein